MIQKFYEWLRSNIKPELWQHYNLSRVRDDGFELHGPLLSCVVAKSPGARVPEFMVLRDGDKALGYGTYMVSLLARYWIEELKSEEPMVLRAHGYRARHALLNLDPSFDVQFEDGVTIGGDAPPTSNAFIRKAK